jgi:hypothetical protein
MQHLCRLVDFLRLVLRPGAGVVDYHPPALWRFVKNIRRQHIGMGRPLAGHHVDAFENAVYGSGQGVNPAD